MPLDDALTLGEVFRFWTTRMHDARMSPATPTSGTSTTTTWGSCRWRSCWPASWSPLFAREDAAASRRARRIDLALFSGWSGARSATSRARRCRRAARAADLHVAARPLALPGPGHGRRSRCWRPRRCMMAARAAWRRAASPRGCAHRAGVEIALVVGIALDVACTNQRVMQQGLDPVLPRARARGRLLSGRPPDYGRFPTFPGARSSARAPATCRSSGSRPPGIVDGRAAAAARAAGGRRTVTRRAGRRTARARRPAERPGPGRRQPELRERMAGERRRRRGVCRSREPLLGYPRTPAELPAKGAIGLLAVSLPAGERHLALVHRPPGLLLGALLTLLGIGLAGVVTRAATPARVAAFWARIRGKAARPQ